MLTNKQISVRSIHCRQPTAGWQMNAGRLDTYTLVELAARATGDKSLAVLAPSRRGQTVVRGKAHLHSQVASLNDNKPHLARWHVIMETSQRAVGVLSHKLVRHLSNQVYIWAAVLEGSSTFTILLFTQHKRAVFIKNKEVISQMASASTKWVHNLRRVLFACS